MTTNEGDPFYVGYQPIAAAAIARGVRHRVLVLGLLALGTAALLALAQRRADPGVFEYGHPRSWHG